MSLALAFLAVAISAAAPSSELAPSLAQTREFAKATEGLIWPGYGAAPFGFLLVEADRESLLCQPGEPRGFEPQGVEPKTGCTHWTRPRSGLPPGLLAAMPILGPPSTIVMGTPEATGRSRGAWLRTILHEHFHQWQTSLPEYYTRVDALDLRGGDETGMWMLNYPFPYDRPAVGEAYAAASLALAGALASRGKPSFLAAYDRYLAARDRFAATVSQRDWRYVEFQLWQEGTARWTEIQYGKIYFDPDVRREAASLERATLDELRAPDLKKQKRLLAYPLGAGEAMLMSACGPAWREAYPSVLSHRKLLSLTREACASARSS